MKVPEVVIVGRVNTGKSTLFNRIIKKPLAIVDNTPGLTRDNIRKLVEWEGVPFYIVDTGGLFPEKEDEIWEKTKVHIEEEVKRASLVIFLVDVKAGLLPGDEEIAQWLRKLGKKVVLAGNKSDVKIKRAEEFLKMGFGEPIAISAAHGNGLTDLMDRVIENIEIVKPHTGKRHKIRVAIVGKPNVGKSSLLNQLTGGTYSIVSSVPGTTRDSIDVETSKFIFVDTAGIKKKYRNDIEYYASLRSAHSISYAEVIIIVLDAAVPINFIDKKIVRLAQESGKGMIIAVNKIDLLKPSNREYILNYINRELPFTYYIPKILLSAKTGERVFILEDILRRVKYETTRRLSDRKAENFITELLAEYSPGVKIYRFFQSRAEPPTFVVISKGKPRNNFLKFLEKRIRDKFGFEGASIKFSIKLRV